MGSLSRNSASLVWQLAALIFFIASALATLTASENSTLITLENERLHVEITKAGGAVTKLYLDGQDLLGTKTGSTGIGPYLDCYCIPSGFYTPGSIAPYYTLYQGTDSLGKKYAGVQMGEVYPPTGQRLEQYWFLREGETGLHTFSRLQYLNETTPFLRNLQEFRTLFRPNTKLWTHLITNPQTYAPLPDLSNTTVVQDATWYIKNRADPYVTQFADYFTKYTFQTDWRDHKVHGLFSDGSSMGNSTFGAWLVMNTVDTYWGGPIHSDLAVDGIVYNYMGAVQKSDLLMLGQR